MILEVFKERKNVLEKGEKNYVKNKFKKARQNIQKWIEENFDLSGYYPDCTTFTSKCKKTLEVFHEELMNGSNLKRNDFEVFREWMQGLGGMLNTADYYYFNDAKDILGGILEESEEEKNKFENSKSEYLMDYLIFRELTKGASM